ncbi:unnamed protein product [Musa acuminata subsp. malaccensis]|uniref:(wild Malaysian banana) hypothetical protein n=1 Tax=Musa acuminata subsp. malaccensis TaxID=214687 RepID=A0A804JVM4_MUSAM|nr:PREDICTED: arabinogalactan peptide 20-like [Musa acuminata subsp. malaccensis]CAG1856556.1 unnamed protein product [Musa acuminata subsp. malaccensis]
MARVPSFLMVVVALVSAIVLVPAVRAQSPAPAPAPTSDGVAIDQGIAYVLMLAALLLTYLIHPLDAASASDKLF